MATGSACPDDATIAALLSGELSEDKRTDALRHAADCGDCRELISELATTEPTVPDGVSKTFDRYELLQALGVGGMGVVYEAHDRELDRRVALKLLREEAGTTARRRSLLAEARAMAKLAHPNVVRVFDVGEHEGRVFITMELVDGGTLRGFIDDRRRSFPEIARIFEDAGRGLAAAHAAGLVHRDFKPENVLLRGATALVSDFGLARVLDASAPPVGALPDLFARGSQASVSTRASAVAGTPHYMAPEQLRGEKVDARSDLFSFGVSFWEALHGEKPFTGESPAELLAAMATGPKAPRARADVPRRAKLALRKALSFAPRDRQASMDAFFAEACLGGGANVRRLGPALLLASAIAIVLGLRMTAASRTHEAQAQLPEATTPVTSPPSASVEPPSSVVAPAVDAGEALPIPARRSALGPSPIAPAVPLAAPLPPPVPSTRPSASTARGAGGIFVESPY